MMWFLLDISPEPWAIGPVGSARRGGKLTSYVGRNAQVHAYEQAVKEAVTEQLPKDFQMFEGKITLEFYFWRNRAEYITPQARTHRKHEADVTNLQKATEDALQGVLFKNDKDVDDVHSVMVAQGPDVQGKVVIGVSKSNDITLPKPVEDLLFDHLNPPAYVQPVLPWGDETEVQF